MKLTSSKSWCLVNIAFNLFLEYISSLHSVVELGWLYLSNMAVSNNVAFVQWLDKYVEAKLEKLVERKVAEAVEGAMKKHRQTLPQAATTGSSVPRCERRRKTSRVSPSTISVNLFGYENYEHMLMPYLTRLMGDTNDMHAVVRQVITDLYFNPAIPANHNVYMPLDSYKSINIMTRSGWETRALNSVLEKMVRRANDILQHYLVASDSIEHNAFRVELGKKKYDVLLQFTNKVDSMERFPDFKDRLVRDAEHSVITTQHLIHKNICRDLVLSRLGAL